MIFLHPATGVLLQQSMLKTCCMKWIAAILCISLFSVASLSCKKSAPAKGKDAVKGNWELTSVSTMSGVSDVAPNTGNTCTFTDNEFKQYEGGQLKVTSTYTITEITGDVVSGYFGTNSSGPVHTVFRVTNGTGLNIDYGSAADGPVFSYRKK